jgi:hypothetical protein
MQAENIALIELGGSHDECLYSQVVFLKKYGFRVHVLIFRDHLKRMGKWPEVDCWGSWKEPAGFAGEWLLVARVLGYLKRNRIRKAVINTAEGNIVRKLTRATGRHIDYTGIIHLARKLWTSRSQRIISRKVRKYLVLSGFIAGNLRDADPSLDVEYFYPVYFPVKGHEAGEDRPERYRPGGPAESAHRGTEARGGKGGLAPPYAQEEFLLCVPGAVDYNRRDYRSLLDELSGGGIPENLRFMLLGRTTGPDGRDLLDRIRDRELESHFITYREFIAPGEFYAGLSRSSLILPLITPGSGDYVDYLKYKITGTYNLAWGFGIPMLMHESFGEYRIFRETSFFYRSGELIRAIRELSGRRGELVEMGRRILGMADFELDYQAGKYVSFISR